MRESDLPSPNIGGRGHHLRRVAAQAISQLEIAAAGYGGKHPTAPTLAGFFTAAADAVAPITDPAELTSAVLSSGDTFDLDNGTLSVAIVGGTPSFTFTPAA